MNDPRRILIVLAGVLLISLGVFGIKHAMDSSGYKKQVSYTTAIQATDADHFNYVVDSQQGRVLSSGTFTVDQKDAVKFDEMSAVFSYVQRVQEHYTMHTREDCTSDGEGHSHCTTETYYTWDYTGEEVKEANAVTYLGRKYPLSLFNTGSLKSDTDCSTFMKPGGGAGWFENKKGCLDGDNYIDDDNRYSYETAPLTFSGTFLATTYGGLHPYNEQSITLQEKTIPQVLHDVGHYQIVGFWVALVLLIILTIAGCISAYAWVIADGIWSVDQ